MPHERHVNRKSKQIKARECELVRDAAAMVSFDSFTGFAYQAFVVSPAISWILAPGRFSKQRGFVYAVSFLVALAAISIVRYSGATCCCNAIALI